MQGVKSCDCVTTVCVCILHFVHGNVLTSGVCWLPRKHPNCSHRQPDETKQMSSSVYTNTFYNHRNNKAAYFKSQRLRQAHTLTEASFTQADTWEHVCAKSEWKGYLKTSFHDWRGGSVRSEEAWNKMLAIAKRAVCEWVSVLRRQEPRKGGGKLLSL